MMNIEKIFIKFDLLDPIFDEESEIIDKSIDIIHNYISDRFIDINFI